MLRSALAVGTAMVFGAVACGGSDASSSATGVTNSNGVRCGNGIVGVLASGRQPTDLAVADFRGHVRQVTHNRAASQPTLKPGGRAIYYASGMGFPFSAETGPERLLIRKSDPDGQHDLPVTTVGRVDQLPTVSPDGTALVFSRRPNVGSRAELVMRDLRSGDEGIVTRARLGMTAAWSPTGKLAWFDYSAT